MKQRNLRERIYGLKVTIVAFASFGTGVTLLALSRAIANNPEWSWLEFWPLGEIGGTLVAAGVFGIVWDYVDGRDREERDDERVRRLLRESAPSMRDAVVEGFAVNPEDLRRVATPEMLDSIASNALGLRLGDEQFAREIYADIRDQAIRAPERWRDVDVNIRLAEVVPGPHAAATPVPTFAVTVQWEYTVVPSLAVQRFACVSDRDEFHELVTDVPATATWFMTPRAGFRANDRSAFEILSYAVDGEERSIRRSERRTGQTYSVTIGDDVVEAGKPVRVSYVYRTLTPQSGHRLFFEIDQPTNGFSLTVDYGNTGISHLSVTDLVASTQKARISRLPAQTSAKVLSVDLPGWLLPKAGFAFVWTLASEEAGERVPKDERAA